MTKPSMFLLALYSLAAGQQCTITSPNNCPTAGSPEAGPPTLQSFVAGAASSLAAAKDDAAGTPQPRMIFSGQLVPASFSYMVFDPMTCPASGTCYFNNISAIQSYIDSLTNPPPGGAGLGSLDVNMWLGPMFETPEYASTCAANGACYTPQSSPNYEAWYTRSLATYDAMFAYAASKHLLMRIAPTPSHDVMATCGIQSGAGNFTEAQIEDCLAPLYAALVRRYAVDYYTLIHEPCGVWELVMGTAPDCAMTVSDTNRFLRDTAQAVRNASKNPNIQLGAGAILTEAGGFPYNCANQGNYWCDWMGLLGDGTLDFAGLDIYPDTSAPSSSYYSGVLKKTAILAAQVPAGKELWANEASSLRWTPLQSGLGEAGAYWGCGSDAWLTSGVFDAWAANVPGAWAPAHGFKGWSLFPTEPLVYVTGDSSNTHCSSQSMPEDTYDFTVMANAGRVSGEGLAYGHVARGRAVSLEGRARLTGRARLGR